VLWAGAYVVLLSCFACLVVLVIGLAGAHAVLLVCFAWLMVLAIGLGKSSGVEVKEACTLFADRMKEVM
jgi:hypothetical protein